MLREILSIRLGAIDREISSTLFKCSKIHFLSFTNDILEMMNNLKYQIFIIVFFKICRLHYFNY